MKNDNMRSKKGFTLIELLIGLVLSIAVLAVAAKLFMSSGSITSLSNYFVRHEMQTRYTAEQINNAIKYTNALFTIPRSSFKVENLTESWSYLGVMDNVRIPEGLVEERENKKGVERIATALVYIKYLGNDTDIDQDKLNKIESSLDKSQDLIKNDDGYFLLTVLDYTYYDETLGYKVEYDLIFTTDTESYVSDAIKYTLKIIHKDKDGNVISEGRNLELETMLNGINLLQAVHQGSRDNPASAIAFHEDGFNVKLKKGSMHANIIFVLDVSTSMEWIVERDEKPTRGEESRIKILKDNVINFLNQFKAYENVYVGFVVFARMGEFLVQPIQASRLSDPSDVEAQTVFTYINNLPNRLSNYTNIGDGLRLAYSQFQSIADRHLNDGATNFLVLMTDGAANAWTTFTPSYYKNKYDSNNKYTTAKRNKINYEFPHKFPHKDDFDDFFWPVDNVGKLAQYLVSSNGQAYYVPKSSTMPKKSTETFTAIADDGKYTLGNSNNSKFSYSRPSNTDYSLDYLEYCAEKITNTDSFPKPILKYFSISKFQGADEQAQAIMDAFGIESSRKNEHVFSINDKASFLTSMTKLVSDIQTSSWLLDGPRV